MPAAQGGQAEPEAIRGGSCREVRGYGERLPVEGEWLRRTSDRKRDSDARLQREAAAARGGDQRDDHGLERAYERARRGLRAERQRCGLRNVPKGTQSPDGRTSSYGSGGGRRGRGGREDDGAQKKSSGDEERRHVSPAAELIDRELRRRKVGAPTSCHEQERQSPAPQVQLLLALRLRPWALRWSRLLGHLRW